MRVVSYTRTTSCKTGDASASDTITGQNERIAAYALSLGLKISEKYSDRKKDKNEDAAFGRLLSDGLLRRFDLVIVDSIYRAGKDLWSAKEILLETFHYAGIAFAVVEDDFCSLGKTNDEAAAYFEKIYGQHRRETIRCNVNARNRQGVLSWNDAKYGYKLSEDNRLVIDEETAPVVKRIFDMAANGVGIPRIAEILSEEKIQSPLSKRGMNVRIDDPFKWTRLSVRRLLDKTVYIGHWIKHVQGEDIPMTNDPIVTEAVFCDVQEILAQNANVITKPVTKHIFAGMMCDKEKGFGYLRVRTLKSGEQCVAYMNAQSGELYGRLLPLEKVREAACTTLRSEQIKAKRIYEKLLADNGAQKQQALSSLKDDYISEAALVAEHERERMSAYEMFIGGQIGVAEMERVEAEHKAFISSSERRFCELDGKRKRIAKAFSEENPWLKAFISWDGAFPQTGKEVKRYFSRIEIERLEIISVAVNHLEWYMEFPKEWRENDGSQE